MVDHSDSVFDKLMDVAKHFAEEGATVELTPKMYRPPKFKYECIYADLIGTKFDGKCPDLRINGVWYEYEGFTTSKPKNAFRNMLNDGLTQSNKIIIDKLELTEAYMKRVIVQRIKDGQDVSEVWIKDGKSIFLLYKKS